MKKFIINSFLLFMLIQTITSCDKMDKNGKLDGTWQMTEWQNKENGDIVATNKDGIYYYVKLDLMKFRIVNKEPTYLSRFQFTKDSLFIGEVYMSPFDSIVDASYLKDFGVLSDGKFHIEKLTNANMVLSNDLYRLSFRKY